MAHNKSIIEIENFIKFSRLAIFELKALLLTSS